MQKPKYITVTLHVMIWTAVLLLPYVLIAPDNEYGKRVCNFFTIANLMHIGLFYLNAFYLYPAFLTRRGWWIYMLSLTVMVAGLFYGKLLIAERWYPGLGRDQNAFAIMFFPILFFLAVSTFYRLVVDKIHSEKTKLSAELRFLRSQVSPHFLFNVLNSLVSMARQKSDLLEPSLIRLSALMRYMLYEAKEDKVSLSMEVSYLQSYIELQKMRFEDDIDIRSHIQYESSGETIEPMLLIPLVENAFKHGVADVVKPFITIELKMNDNVLLFDVRNRFSIDAGSKDQNSGIGLDNLKARLNLLYPRQHKFTTLENDGVFHSKLTIKLK